jgi:hypothetical protein
MANYTAAARTRAALAGKAPAGSYPVLSDSYRLPFTDDMWALEQRLRESVDALLTTVRWSLTVIPSDGFARTFFLKGTRAQVTRRASEFFADQTSMLVIEPAQHQSGGELIDKRLTDLITTGRMK